MILISAAATNSPLSTILLVFIHPFTSTLLVLIVVLAHEDSVEFEHSFEAWMISMADYIVACLLPSHGTGTHFPQERHRTRHKITVNEDGRPTLHPAATSTIWFYNGTAVHLFHYLPQKPPSRRLALMVVG